MRILNNEKGTILITMLLLMIIVTLIGVIAINTATVDIQITGNTKRESIAMGAAEAGVDLSIPIIENSVSAGGLVTPTTADNNATSFTISGNTITPDASLEGEIFEDQTAAILEGFDAPADISIASFGTDSAGINIDIDRMYSYMIPGGSIEFASGYEGIGAGAAGGGVGILYKINSQGTK